MAEPDLEVLAVIADLIESGVPGRQVLAAFRVFDETGDYQAALDAFERAAEPALYETLLLQVQLEREQARLMVLRNVQQKGPS